MKQKLFALSIAMVIFAILAVPARADQYGEVHGTTTEAPREEITHGTVQTGLGDNLLVFALMTASGAFGLILIAN